MFGGSILQPLHIRLAPGVWPLAPVRYFYGDLQIPTERKIGHG
jgi:hypothetical protein